MKGGLPWQGFQGNNYQQRVLEVKQNVTKNGTLFDGIPSVFSMYFDYVFSLDFEQEPDYEYLRKLFRDLMGTHRYSYDYEYDWTLRKKQFEKEDEDQLLYLSDRMLKINNV